MERINHILITMEIPRDEQFEMINSNVAFIIVKLSINDPTK